MLIKGNRYHLDGGDSPGLVTNSLRPSGLRLIDTGIPIMLPVEANNPIVTGKIVFWDTTWLKNYTS